MHVFPYSPREGTAAYSLPDVDNKVKTARAAALGEIKGQLKRNFAEKFCGKTCQVLCERQKNGLFEGYTAEYLRVYYEKGSVGKVEQVKILSPYLDGAKGEKV